MTSEVSEYWINRWHNGDTPWHKEDINPLLQENLQELIADRQNIRILIPLCGKALELKWFSDQGHTVVGAEYSSLSIESFFKQHSIEYVQHRLDDINGFVYKATDRPLTIYCCSFYELDGKLEEKFDAIWDRGSLVAVEPTDRQRYATILKSLMAPQCRYLIETYEFDESFDTEKKFPHSVEEAVISELYADSCQSQRLARLEDEKRHQSRAPLSAYFYQSLWLLTLKE